VLQLDTQIILWLAREPEKVSLRAVQAIARARSEGEGIAVASISLFEIALLAAKKRLHFHTPVEALLEKIELTYRVIPLGWKIAAQSMRFSDSYPNDPADRQIGATAVVEGFKLVTADAQIRKSGEVPCIW
jgi:PIN domain nuclease of toxin-antitoxin system